MANRTKAPVIDNPELLDRIIGNIQNGLVDNLPWLDFAFGRAERLVKANANQNDIIHQTYIPGKTITWK